MNVLWFEFMLSLRRLFRRRGQNGLMLVTFALSLTLALLSWSLFHTIFLSQPDFDPKGEYYILNYEGGVASSGKTHSTVDELEAYRAGGRDIFADFALVTPYLSLFVETPRGEERVLAAFPSSRALQVAGAKPLLGGLFTAEDDKLRAPTKILLSEHMWTNSFGRDPTVVGRNMEVFGGALVVGIMPASFRFPNDQDLWVSYGRVPNDDAYPMRDALVKLKPGITVERAERDLQVILNRLGPQSTANKNGLRPALLPLRDFYLLPEIRVSALILFGLSLIFVLVSCANAANLMLIDFLSRRPEVAASLALGVPRAAAIRAVCFQAAIIAAAAVVLALAVLPVAGPLLYERVKIITAPYWLTYHFEWHYVGLAAGLGALSALVTVIAPIAYLLWADAEEVIRGHAAANRGTGRALWRRLLLTGQIALLTILAVSAGLLVRSSYHVGQTRWGYSAEQVFMGKISGFGLDLPRNGYRPRGWLAAFRRGLEQVKLRPETAAAAFAENAPGYSSGPYCPYALDPAGLATRVGPGAAFYSQVTENFFDVLEVPFVAGGMFPRENAVNGPHYAVINESLAYKLWPGQDPLQKTLYVRFARSKDTYATVKDTDQPEQLTICGIVRDFQASGPVAKTNDGIFTPFVPELGAGAGVFLVVRDRGGVPETRSLTDAIHRAEPRLALFFPSTIAGQIRLVLSSVRMTTALTTMFAIAAVLLCAIGVYSLTAAQVVQSAREFGIRMALGAEAGRLWRDFTRGHLIAALVGVALGLAAASQVVRVLSALLYGVNPYSPGIYAGVALAILGVAALACVPSLFRLRRINPADCLRSL